VGERDEKMARKITVTKSFFLVLGYGFVGVVKKKKKIRYLFRFLEAIQIFVARRGLLVRIRERN
jgi:hypothetical protein